MLAVIAVVAFITSSMERRSVPIGSALIILAGVAGCAALLSREGTSIVDIVPTVVGTVCGVAVLRLFDLGTIHRRTRRPDVLDRDDRLSLMTLGLLTAGACTGVAGVVLSRARSSVAGDRSAFALPAVDVGAPPIPPTVQPKGVALSVVRHEQ